MNDNDKQLSGIERRNKNLKPFKKASELSPEERERQREISIKGALCRAEKQRNEKTMKETTLMLLKTPLSRKDAEKLIGDKADMIDDKELTMQTVLTLRLMDSLLSDGNAKAFEVLRDTAGQKPRDEMTITADIMTDADRSLMDKINARLSEKGV